jgi:hypothetical protein
LSLFSSRPIFFFPCHHFYQRIAPTVKPTVYGSVIFLALPFRERKRVMDYENFPIKRLYKSVSGRPVHAFLPKPPWVAFLGSWPAIFRFRVVFAKYFKRFNR